jgi:hypothetical protein
MSTGAEHVGRGRTDRARRQSLEDQVRGRGLKPIASVDDLACDGIFDTDEELDEFLAHVYAERHANMA